MIGCGERVDRLTIILGPREFLHGTEGQSDRSAISLSGIPSRRDCVCGLLARPVDINRASLLGGWSFVDERSPVFARSFGESRRASSHHVDQSRQPVSGQAVRPTGYGPAALNAQQGMSGGAD